MTPPPHSSDADDTWLLLRDRRFLQYLSSRVSSTLAYQILSVAVGWHVYALTGSPFFLGLVGLAQFLPMFLLTLVVGHAADRYDRLSILRVCRLVMGAGALALAVGSYSGWLGKEGILAVLLVLGAARAFEVPTQAALLPGLVRTGLFPRAVAWATSSAQTASVLGPAFGGLLYAAGASVAYATITFLFLASGLLVSLIRMERKAVKPEPVTPRSLFAGITFVKSSPAILGAISLDLFAVLLGGATALLPVYARNILLTGPAGLGLLRSAPAAGALLTSLFLARHPLKRPMGRTMFAAVFVFGGATVVFALSSSFLLSLLSLAVLGSADVVSVVIRQTLVQMETPDAMRGRVNAVNSMFVGTSNQLGEFESGVTAAWFGAVPAVLIGGIGTMVVAALWMRLFPALARFDRPQAEG